MDICMAQGITESFPILAKSLFETRIFATCLMRAKPSVTGLRLNEVNEVSGQRIGTLHKEPHICIHQWTEKCRPS
jgi:hypothetical protein